MPNKIYIYIYKISCNTYIIYNIHARESQPTMQHIMAWFTCQFRQIAMVILILFGIHVLVYMYLLIGYIILY